MRRDSAAPGAAGITFSDWVTRDHRWQPRGSWKWAVRRDLPQLYYEFNGIDFGHAHLAETALEDTRSERDRDVARLEVVDFIFSAPPRTARRGTGGARPSIDLAWEVARRPSTGRISSIAACMTCSPVIVEDKVAVYRKLLDDYLAKPEAITPHRLDHHYGALELSRVEGLPRPVR